MKNPIKLGPSCLKVLWNNNNNLLNIKQNSLEKNILVNNYASRNSKEETIENNLKTKKLCP